MTNLWLKYIKMLHIASYTKIKLKKKHIGM